jgi:hypothetical protein
VVIAAIITAMIFWILRQHSELKDNGKENKNHTKDKETKDVEYRPRRRGEDGKAGGRNLQLRLRWLESEGLPFAMPE